MGVADLIPGISGGTVAVLGGIYEDFIEAIYWATRDLPRKLLSFKFKDIMTHPRFLFLIKLALGIFSGILLLGKVLAYFLENNPFEVWSLFFGLILVSTLVLTREYVFSHQDKKNLKILGIFILGILIGLCMTLKGKGIDLPDHQFFLIIVGFFAFSAMLLPGISGSYILVLLGKYSDIIQLLKELPSFESLKSLTLFGIGGICSFIGMSWLIKRLFKNREKEVMLFMMGLVWGSMHQLWPFRHGSWSLAGGFLFLVGMTGAYLLTKPQRSTSGF